MKVTELNASKNKNRNLSGIFVSQKCDGLFYVAVSITGHGTNYLMSFRTKDDAMKDAERIKTEMYTGLRVYVVNYDK